MKNIFIPVTSGRIVRNLLRTDVLKLLKTGGYQPVVLVESALQDEFKDDLNLPDLIVASYQRPRYWEKKFLIFRYLDTYSAATNFSVKSETIFVKRKRMKERELIKYFFTRTANFLVYRFQFLKDFLRWLDWKLFPKKWCSDLFQKYQPVLVLSTDMMTNQDEIYVLEGAQNFNVPIMASILSWDNLSGYGKLPIHVNRGVIVWNKIMKDQLLRWHGFKGDEIYIAGVPSYDIYAKMGDNCLTREQFFKTINADPNKKLITYTTAPTTICDIEDQTIDVITKAIRQNRLVAPIQLLIRLHPKDNRLHYKSLEGMTDIIFDNPGLFNAAFSDQWSPTEQDVIHLLATLKHSDIIINVASTITIEAAIFNKPIINIGFDGYQKKSYYESVLRYYQDYTHYINIIKASGVRLAKSAEDLIYFINQYLNQPSLDVQGRRRIVEEQASYLDGRASERVANYIINNVKNF